MPGKWVSYAAWDLRTERKWCDVKWIERMTINAFIQWHMSHIVFRRLIHMRSVIYHYSRASVISLSVSNAFTMSTLHLDMWPLASSSRLTFQKSSISACAIRSVSKMSKNYTTEVTEQQTDTDILWSSHLRHLHTPYLLQFLTIPADNPSIKNVTIQYSAYSFLFAFHRQYASISCHFQDTESHLSKVAIFFYCTCIRGYFNKTFSNRKLDPQAIVTGRILVHEISLQQYLTNGRTYGTAKNNHFTDTVWQWRYKTPSSNPQTFSSGKWPSNTRSSSSSSNSIS